MKFSKAAARYVGNPKKNLLGYVLITITIQVGYEDCFARIAIEVLAYLGITQIYYARLLTILMRQKY